MTLRFVHDERRIGASARAIAPIGRGDRSTWLVATSDARLVEYDGDRGTLVQRGLIDDPGIALDQPIVIHVSPDQRLAMVANRNGLRSMIFDLETGACLQRLARDGYHEEQCIYPFAFVERGGRTLAIHSPEWNRLDAIDARTGELLTARAPTSYTRDEEQPPHYLDYFHCGLHVSPSGRHLADNGWIWHPVGSVTAWSLDAWLGEHGNVWESEDGPTRHTLVSHDGYWDRPLVWIDDTHVLAHGLGDPFDTAADGAAIYDVTDGTESARILGPSRGWYTFDRVLVVQTDEVTTVWDVARGAQLLEGVLPGGAYHPFAKQFLAYDGTIARLAGLDAHLATGVVADLARAIARDRSWDELPVLGDALEAAGVTDRELLDHCHADHTDHGTSCWVLDRLGVTVA